jgi:hypothetical protein
MSSSTGLQNKGSGFQLMQDEQKTNSQAEGTPSQANEATAIAEKPRNPNMKWYIIHSYSGLNAK